MLYFNTNVGATLTAFDIFFIRVSAGFVRSPTFMRSFMRGYPYKILPPALPTQDRFRHQLPYHPLQSAHSPTPPRQEPIPATKGEGWCHLLELGI